MNKKVIKKIENVNERISHYKIFYPTNIESIFYTKSKDIITDQFKLYPLEFFKEDLSLSSKE